MATETKTLREAFDEFEHLYPQKVAKFNFDHLDDAGEAMDHIGDMIDIHADRLAVANLFRLLGLAYEDETNAREFIEAVGKLSDHTDLAIAELSSQFLCRYWSRVRRLIGYEE